MLLCLFNVSGAEEKTSAGQKPLFIAHYMTWFGIPETSGQWYLWKFMMQGIAADKQHDPDYFLPNGRRNIAAVHYPVIGPYDSTDPDVLEYHVLLAKEAGIDGFMVNWYGLRDRGERRQEDKGFEQLLRTAERLDFKVCINFDDKCSFPPYQNLTGRKEAVNYAKETLKEAMFKYASSPAYLKIDGRPVISNFGWWYVAADSMEQTSFSPAEWKEIIDYLKDYRPFFIHDYQYHWKKSIEETGFLTSADSVFPWIGMKNDRIAFIEESRKLLKEGKIRMVSGIANPGFDNTACQGWGGGISIIPRREGQEYRDNLDEAIRYGAGFIQIVTWNDFTEGSTVEPTEEYGDLYLKITSEYANRYGAPAVYGRSLDLPQKIYALRKLTSRLKESGKVPPETLSEIENNTDRSVDSLIKHDRIDSEKLLAEARGLAEDEEKKLPADKKIEAALSSASDRAVSGETVDFALRIKNPYDETISAMIQIDCYGIPRQWLVKSGKTVSLEAGEEKTEIFQVQVPEDAAEISGWLTARILSSRAPVTSNLAYITVLRGYLYADIGPVNLLRAGRSEKLDLSLDSRQKGPEPAKITFAAPEGWTVRPSIIFKEIPKEGKISVPFTLKAPKGASRNGTLAVSILSGTYEYTIREPFAVLLKNKAAVMEGDINQDGSTDLVLGNGRTELHCTPSIGGRILAVIDRSSGRNQLFLDYPKVEKTKGDSADKWAEYGGINDTFPGEWPGAVWNNDWDYRVVAREGDAVSAVLSAKTKDGLLIQKGIIVHSDSPFIGLRYELRNTTNQPREVFWSNHPDLAPGGEAGPEDIMILPAAEHSYSPSLTKTHHTPAEDWMLAYDSKTGECFGQVFDKSLVEKIGIWEGKNFFTMEQISGKITLKPGESKNFMIDYIAGRDSPGNIVKLLRNK
jgi:hypothetical protein